MSDESTAPRGISASTRDVTPAASPRSIRAGLIGCGKIATIHALALHSLPHAEFVAVCDTEEGRARAMAEKYGVPHVFNDARTLLHSGLVEAVLVCTPHPAHAPLVIAAAEAGVHVLCEKPMTIDLGEADRMIEATRRAGVRFGVIHQRRFWPASQRLRAAIDGGKLGNLTYGECETRLWRPEEYFRSDPWRGKWATEGGGVLMNQAVHMVDLFQWFMNQAGPAVEVYGRIATLRHGAYIDVEDTAVATVVFQRGALGVIMAATTFQPEFGFRVAVHGDRGAYAGVREWPEGRQGINDVWTIPGEASFRDVWEWEERDKPGFPGFHVAQIGEFLQAVAENRDPAVTGEEARKSIAIILAIYESSRTGKPVRLSP